VNSAAAADPYVTRCVLSQSDIAKGKQEAVPSMEALLGVQDSSDPYATRATAQPAGPMRPAALPAQSVPGYDTRPGSRGSSASSP
jgi:hypothetical protein